MDFAFDAYTWVRNKDPERPHNKSNMVISNCAVIIAEMTNADILFHFIFDKLLTSYPNRDEQNAIIFQEPDNKTDAHEF